MMKFSAINTNILIIGAAVAGAGYWFINRTTGGGTLATLKQGLAHPLEAVMAAAGSAIGIDPKIQGGTEITENYNYYLLLNGGMDAYIEAHQNGTWDGEPFYNEKDYKKLYFAQKPVWSL